MKLKKLKTKYLGRTYFYYDKIDSTQNEIWRLTEKNISNGTVVMAGTQTNGKGTHGRRWYTDTPNNIAFSFYIELDCNIKKIEGITTEIAEILIDIMKRFYNIEIGIKSPNDLVYNGKKIGGILTESKMNGENVRFLVVGIGINTSQTDFNNELKNIATSITKEFNIEINAKDVIAEFCNCFEQYILKLI